MKMTVGQLRSLIAEQGESSAWSPPGGQADLDAVALKSAISTIEDVRELLIQKGIGERGTNVLSVALHSLRTELKGKTSAPEDSSVPTDAPPSIDRPFLRDLHPDEETAR